MNEEYVSLSELFDEFSRRKLTKGTLLRTLENYISAGNILVYADANYCSLVKINGFLEAKKDIYKAEKLILPRTERIYLFRKNLTNNKKTLEIVTSLFITRQTIAKIDTQIFDNNHGKIKSFWFSQIQDFEEYLEESGDVKLRKIDGMLLDVKTERNENLNISQPQKKLKRFANLDFD